MSNNKSVALRYSDGGSQVDCAAEKVYSLPQGDQAKGGRILRKFLVG